MAAEALAVSALEKLNNFLDQTGLGFHIDLVDPGEIQYAEKNARYMDDATMRRLKSNVEQVGFLESSIFCYKDKGKYRTISGNHRLEAAINAGVPKILVIYPTRKLTRDEIISKQLAHNAIVGKDDMVVLAELYNEIQDITAKEATGLDDETLKQLEKMTYDTIKETRLDFESVTLEFFPEEKEEIEKVFESVLNAHHEDENWVLKYKDYETFFNLIKSIKKNFNILNNSMALLKIFELAGYKLNALAGESGENWVALPDLFGTFEIPEEIARLVESVTEKAIKKDVIKKSNKWQLIEFAFAELNQTLEAL